MAKVINIKKGKYAIVDDDDFWLVNRFNWRLGNSRKRYAIRRLHKKNKPETSMHQTIMRFPKSNIDHINGNELDNRKENLRLCNQSQNCANSRPQKNNKLGHKGVSYDKFRKIYYAGITVRRKHIHIGTFLLPCVASRAYDTVARKEFGEFARPNTPELPSIDIERFKCDRRTLQVIKG
ncbi:MAG: Fis family transcriptional regulator [bacterium]|nr:Fis family transcriptional regulator [bacterium]